MIGGNIVRAEFIGIRDGWRHKGKRAEKAGAKAKAAGVTALRKEEQTEKSPPFACQNSPDVFFCCSYQKCPKNFLQFHFIPA